MIVAPQWSQKDFEILKRVANRIPRGFAVEVTDIDFLLGRSIYFKVLPGASQVKRIVVGRKRSSRFLGSEVSLEDLGARSQSRFTHTWLRDEDVAGESCHVVEAVPRDPESGYAKLVLWRELKTLRAVKVAYTTLVRAAAWSKRPCRPTLPSSAASGGGRGRSSSPTRRPAARRRSCSRTVRRG